MRKGSTGSAVKKLQGILGITKDGIFGSETESAVKSFQKRKDLRVNGVVNSNVWRALLGKSYEKTGESSSGEDSSTEIPKTIRRGSTGAAVKELQRILDITVDGVFGSGTESAVKAFQRREDLTVDGIVGASTWRALKNISGDSGGGSTDGGDSTDDSSSDIPRTVRRGSTGSAVKKLQGILGITKDGIFGSGTESSVKSFQRKHSLTADGIVGPNTWKVLLDSSSSGGAQSIRPASFGTTAMSPAIATVTTTTEFNGLKSLLLAEGARSSAVKTAQRVLGGVAVDGVFGPRTTRAVRTFQSEAGLRATGVVDEQTWDALEEAKYPFLGYRSTVLRPGATGPAVTALQKQLGLAADGVYGPATEDAVRAAQQRHGITRTGYVGAVTWQALEREARVPA